jgi:putative transposase
MGIEEVLTAPQSPWQNRFAERLIGLIRRECLDHVVVLGERHLRRILTAYFAYYHRTALTFPSRRTLRMDGASSRQRSARSSRFLKFVALHHRYIRRAA